MHITLSSTAAILGALATVASAYQDTYYYQPLSRRISLGSFGSSLGREGSSLGSTAGREGSTLGREGSTLGSNVGHESTAAGRAESGAARQQAAPNQIPGASNVPAPGVAPSRGSGAMNAVNTGANVLQGVGMVGMMVPHDQGGGQHQGGGGGGPTAPTAPTAPGRKREAYVYLDDEFEGFMSKRDPLAGLEEEVVGMLYTRGESKPVRPILPREEAILHSLARREAEAEAEAEVHADAFYEVLFGRDAEAEADPEADDE
ncbi:hypothetical protein MMC10_006343 [Thelotrema lepadinum]|nr:hypothetical protein [Thelotrema lepadinum]